MLKYLSTTLLGLISLASLAAQQDSIVNDLKPNDKQRVTTKLVSRLLEKENYKKIPFNDSLSNLVFGRYLKNLDPNRSFFTALEIMQFEKLKNVLDDDLKSGNLDNAFSLFNAYRISSIGRYKQAIAETKKKIDYNIAETYTQSRDAQPFFEDEVNIADYWRRKVKYEMLVLKLAGTQEAEARNILVKRYNNLISQTTKLTGEDVYQSFMTALTASVDPHAAYFTPFNASQFNMNMTRTLEGIGATLNVDNELVIIKDITIGGPAYKTGKIQKGDKIIAVAQGADGKFEDVIGWRINEVVALIRGEKGTSVRLKVIPNGKNLSDPSTEVSIIRDKIILEDQSAKKDVKRYTVNGKEMRIGFISIPQFYLDTKALQSGSKNYKSTTTDVALLLDSLKAEKVDGVVIDIRGNGGGSLTEAVNLTGLFLTTGPIVQIREINGEAKPQQDSNPLIAYSGPLAVLVDRASASASEIFSAAIQDYNRGIIIGSNTYGKGTVQLQVDLDKLIMKSDLQQEAVEIINAEPAKDAPVNKRYFGQFNLTVGKFYRITGSSTQHKGVNPDIILPSLIQSKAYGEDTEVSALPWDTIAKMDYRTVSPNPLTNQMILNLHNKRFSKPGLTEYIRQISLISRKVELQKALPLKYEELKKLTENREREERNRTNLIRKEMGEPLLIKGKPDAKKVDIDFEKREAGQILSDVISAINKHV